jgi:hypothetical protein
VEAFRRFNVSTLESFSVSTPAVWDFEGVSSIRACRANLRGQRVHAPCLSARLDSPHGNAYQCDVVIESIREFNRAVPFVPYEVRMNGGESYAVPHPDFF